MADNETQQRFIFLRSQGWSYTRIMEELKLSKPTLINWSRKFQYEIQNTRTMASEALLEKWLLARDLRVNAIGEVLRKAEAELAKRNINELSTGSLLALVERLRRQIKQEIGPLKFTSPVGEIPTDEYHEQVQDWIP